MTDGKKRVKFIGDFKDLIPAGWQFGKAYARNYQFYAIGVDHSDWRLGSSFKIWKAGREFALGEHNKHVVAIVEKVISGFDDWVYTLPRCGTVVSWLIFDKKENRFIPYGTREYIQIRHSEWVDYDAYLARYETVNIGTGSLRGIADLLAKNWIKIE